MGLARVWKGMCPRSDVVSLKIPLFLYKCKQGKGTNNMVEFFVLKRLVSERYRFKSALSPSIQKIVIGC